MRPRYGIPLLVLVLLAAPLGSVRADSDDLIGIGDLPPASGSSTS